MISPSAVSSNARQVDLVGDLSCAMQIDVRDNIKAVLANMDGHKRAVLDKAIPAALNRTGEMARTYAGRTLRAEGYNFKAREILNAIYLSKASSRRMVLTMRIRRRAKMLLQFNARETKQGVRVKVKGAAKLIKGAFIGQLRNGEQAVFVEDKTAGKTILRKSREHAHGSKGGWHAYPVRRLYGPSIGGAYANQAVLSNMQAFIAERFTQRLAHEVKRLSR